MPHRLREICSRPKSDRRAERVLVIGLDGASYELLVPLVEQGVMPQLAAWLRRAEQLELGSTQPPITPTAWTTFLTGCQPWDHGVFDYRYLDRRKRQLRLNDAGRIRCPTLYDAVSAAGDAVVSLNLPMTWPRQKNVRGIVVGGIDAPSPAAALADQPQLARELQRQGLEYPLELVWKRRPRSYDELCAGVRRTGEVFASRAAAAEAADGLCDWRLMVVQFQTLDALQHRLWDLLIGRPDAVAAPGHTGRNARANSRWVNTARQAMRALDRQLGRLFELAARRGAEVMIVSDHGFGPFRQTIQLPELLGRAGLQRQASLWQRIGYRRQRMVWKWRKSWHRRVRRTVRTAMVPRPLGALLPVDWRRTAAVTLHSNMGALVYVNRPERFGRGPIRTDAVYDEVVEHTVAVLEEASHPQTGEPLFSTIYRVAEQLGRDPLEIDAPDVLAIPAPGFHTRSKPSRDGRLVIDNVELTGTHRHQGVWMRETTGRAADNAQGDKRATASLCEVAPRVLERLGIEVPPSMGNKASHTGPPPCPARPRHGNGIGRATTPTAGSDETADGRLAGQAVALGDPTDGDSREVEYRLRALGYLD